MPRSETVGLASQARADAVPTRVLAFAALYRWPLLAVALLVPLALLSTATSLDWIGRTFPGFFLMENRVVPTFSGYRWPPDRGALFHHQVVAVDGAPVRSAAQVLEQVAARPAGTTFTYTVRGEGGEAEVALPSRRFDLADFLQTYGILLLFGWINLALGASVGFLQPRTPQARVFVLHSAFASAYALSGVFLHRGDFPWLGRLCLAAEAITPATFVHLALVFPLERSFDGWRRVWPALPYLVSAALVALVFGGIGREPPVLVGLHLSYLYMVAALVFFAGNMALLYARGEGAAATPRWQSVRPRIRLVLPGALLAAVAAQGFIFLDNALGGRELPVQTGLLAPLPYYAAVAYAIARHDLFDVDRVVRQAYVYLLLSGLVAGAYVLLLQLPARLVQPLGGTLPLEVAFVLALALALDPLRRLMQGIVDRTFYRSRVDYRATVRDVSARLATTLQVREVADLVTRAATEALQLSSAGIVVHPRVAPAGERPRSQLWWRRAEGELRIEGIDAAPDVGGGDGLVMAETDVGPLHAVASLELRVAGSAVGVLLLGSRRSGQAFDGELLDLLRTLASQTAVALHNGLSYRELEELNRDLDAQVRQRTVELRASNQQLTRAYDELKEAQAQLVQSEKMASLGQLVAGVAHELNNPASFVHGSLANLIDYLDRFRIVLEVYERAGPAEGAAAREIAAVRERVQLDYVLRQAPELLRVCARGSERIKRIVDDLRTFARSDSGERGPCRLAEGIETTLRLLAVRIEQAGVAVRRSYGDVPPLKANEAQLNQVWMNVLSNALDAVEGRPGGAIEVVLRVSPEDTAVVVEVRDNGAGIPAQVRPRIFEPFFTTKPIGRGTGLGLSIAYGAVKSHGGAIEVESEEGEGTLVRILLPA